MGASTLNRYTIMHGDRKVACIHKDGRCVIYNAGFMPYNLYLEPAEDENIDDRINNLQNFYSWCSSRLLTLDRKYAKEILNYLGQKQAVTDKDRAMISITYHSLSLMDIYWVKGFRENISFQDISLYTHSLTDAFVDVSLRGKELTLQNGELLDGKDVAGDVGTPGVAPKAWIRNNNTFTLLKDGSQRDVDAELLASRILDCFNVKHVKYYETEYKGQKVSACDIITSQDKSIVTAEYVDIYAINHDTDLMSLVYEKSYYEYHMMNIMDYLLGNNDRHWGNWGFFVDNKTNRLLELHPLMDFNKAFSAYGSMTGAMCLTGQGNITQQDAAVNAVRLIGLNQTSDVQKEWFYDESDWKMFNMRLDFLKTFEKKRK